MLVVKMFDPIMGVDVHMILTPPGAILPIPHPFIGIVWDAFAYLPFIGTTVYHAGIPTAQAGTSGKAVPPHFPIGGTFTVPPGNDAEIFMGSATVLANGAPLTRMGERVLSCQTIGMPAPPRLAAKKQKRATGLFLPTSTVMAIPAGKPVMVGGPSTIDVMSLAIGVGLKAAGAVFRRVAARVKGAKKAANRADDLADSGKKNAPSNNRNHCGRVDANGVGHPVDVATGKVWTERVDFALPGPIPLVWERVYFSTSDDYAGPLGVGWHHAYDLSLRRSDNDTLEMRLPDGRLAFFHDIKPQDTSYIVQEQLTLSREGDNYIITDADYLRHIFDGDRVREGALARVRCIERAGAKIEFDYNDRGYLTGIVDSGGRRLTVDNDDRGRILQISAPHPLHGTGVRAPLVRYEYDALGDLIASYDAADHAFNYVYRNHLLIREKNRNGFSFYFEYEDHLDGAWCTRTWGDGGIHENTLVYERDRQLTTVTNSLGQTTEYYWNDLGMVHRTVDPLGHAAVRRFTAAGKVRHHVDENGRLTKFAYDRLGNLVAVALPDGTDLQMSYAGHHLTAAADQNGGTWSWSYNDAHQLTDRSNPEGETTEYEYAGPNVRAVTDPAGNRSELHYDAANNLIRLDAADGTRSTWAYDALGRTTESKGPTGATERYRYNLRGDLLKLWEADGNITGFAYDGEENVTRIKDKLRDVRMEYGGFNRLVARTENGTRVEFNYDTQQKLTGIINEHGYAYRFGRDGNGEVVREQAYDGMLHEYLRDPAGQVTAVVKPGGRRTDYGLDVLGRLTEVTYPDGERDRFSYRADGRLTTAANATATVSYERDKLGRVLSETSNGVRIDSKYDRAGNRQEVQSSLGTKSRYRYNQLGDLEGVTTTRPGKRDWTAEFQHNHVGLEIERSMPGGVTTNFQRDRLGRLTRQTTRVGGRADHSRAYDWGSGGRLQSLTIDQKEKFLYEYDAVGNLAAATYPSGQQDLRLPDAVGNLFRTKERGDREYNPAGQLLRSGYTTYTYDGEGNLIERTVGEAGVRRHDRGKWQYRWNGAGRLTEVLRPDGDVVTFTYDALGRRLSKSYRDKTTRWAWDGNVPLHEWLENNRPSSGFAKTPDDAVSSEVSPANERATPDLDDLVDQLLQEVNGELNTYLYEPGSFTPLAKFTPTRDLSVVADHLGTPAALYDGEGHKVWENRMDIYGRPLWTDGLALDMCFRYPGQYEDNETGLSYNRFRYYDAGEGVYISRDPIGLAGGNPTLYGYVGDVNSAYDASGLAICGGDRGIKGIKMKGKAHRYETPGREATSFDAHKWNVASSHRYTREGVGGVYGGTSRKTAHAEISHYVVDVDKIKVHITKEYELNNVLDLTDSSVRQKLGVTFDDITSNSYDKTHQIGDWAIDNGFDGILAPSARNPGGANIISFSGF